MKLHAAALAVLSVTALAQTPDSNAYYKFTPDAWPQPGVPRGEIRGPFTLPSQAYPGTQHTYWVYVPAQYDAAAPASLMIFNDGQAFMAAQGDIRAQFVLDNLIYRREIPVMIAVFINPGRRPDQPEPTLSEWGDRTTNRPAEYNTLDDKYARVIVEELLPVLYKEYNISRDADRHGIGGSSSGAIAAFTVAWQRPDVFRKVLSNVGSFTNIRGGNAYPDIIRQSEKKPLRIFLVDGRNDNRGVRNGAYDAGWDWFLQNTRMQQALAEKSYDLNYSWGMQSHGQKMLRAVFPDMMRWLWRDQPVSTDPNNAVERSYAAAKGALPAPPSTDQSTLLDLEQHWVEALVKPDPAALDAILGDRFTDTDEDGDRTDKRGVLEALRSGDLKMASIQLSEMKAYVYGDCAVVTGAALQNGRFQGRSLTPRVVFTDTFLYENGRWAPVASQRSRAK